MKKFLSAALSLTLALSLAACSSGTSGNGSSGNASNSNLGSSNNQNAQYVIKLCHEQVDGDPIDDGPAIIADTRRLTVRFLLKSILPVS